MLNSSCSPVHAFHVSVYVVSSPAGDCAERGEGEQRGSERSSERADREAALPADPGGGAGEPAQTGELLHLRRELKSGANDSMNTHKRILCDIQ